MRNDTLLLKSTDKRGVVSTLLDRSDSEDAVHARLHSVLTKYSKEVKVRGTVIRSLKTDGILKLDRLQVNTLVGEIQGPLSTNTALC